MKEKAILEVKIFFKNPLLIIDGNRSVFFRNLINNEKTGESVQFFTDRLIFSVRLTDLKYENLAKKIERVLELVQRYFVSGEVLIDDYYKTQVSMIIYDRIIAEREYSSKLELEEQIECRNSKFYEKEIEVKDMKKIIFFKEDIKLRFEILKFHKEQLEKLNDVKEYAKLLDPTEFTTEKEREKKVLEEKEKLLKKSEEYLIQNNYLFYTIEEFEFYTPEKLSISSLLKELAIKTKKYFIN